MHLTSRLSPILLYSLGLLEEYGLAYRIERWVGSKFKLCAPEQRTRHRSSQCGYRQVFWVLLVRLALSTMTEIN